MFAPARADVAQLVEQRFRKPQVTGSNPVVGSLLFTLVNGIFPREISDLDVYRGYDEGGNAIDTHEHRGDFKEP